MDEVTARPLFGYIACMYRRALILLVVLAISLVSYQPTFAMSAPSMQTQDMDAEPCPEDMHKHDCCDPVGSQQTCKWDATCAARCHINTGIESVLLVAPVLSMTLGSVLIGSVALLVPERPSPLIRPPIL